jgi:predicted RNase H-like nuclease (RuvC/YqgF family)
MDWKNYNIVCLSIFILLLVSSCGPSKKELQEEINAKSDTIMLLRKAISEKSEYIENLQEKLDNVKSRAEDVQAALEDGSFSDAYDAATDTEDEAEYDEY